MAGVPNARRAMSVPVPSPSSPIYQRIRKIYYRASSRGHDSVHWFSRE